VLAAYLERKGLQVEIAAGGAGALNASRKGDAKERIPMMSKPSEWTRLSTVVAFKYIVGVGAVLLLFSAVGCGPVSRDVLQRLPADQARELEVYSTHHAVVFDPRIHSVDTCPFLSYLPNVTFMDHNSKEYADWLYHFYSMKHEEEQDLWHCTCNQELSGSVGTGSKARP
jgi:hypothetical protein